MRGSALAFTLGFGLAMLTIARLVEFGPPMTTAQLYWSLGTATALEVMGAVLLFMERYTDKEG